MVRVVCSWTVNSCDIEHLSGFYKLRSAAVLGIRGRKEAKCHASYAARFSKRKE
jgi:hypothetical protein